MAYTRSLMKSLGLNDDQINTLMDEHLNVVNELKQQRDDLKGKAEEAGTAAEKIAALQKELDELRTGDFKTKYEKEHTAFEAYKEQIAKEAEQQKVRTAYQNLLAEEKIGEKYRDAVMRATPLDGLKLNAEGHLEEADRLRESIRKQWSDFVVSESQRGAEVQTPPGNDKSAFGSMSLGEKMAYANTHPNAPEVTEWLKK